MILQNRFNLCSIMMYISTQLMLGYITTLKCETPDGWSSDQIFKIDTGAGCQFNAHKHVSALQLFPKVSLDALNKTVNKSVTLFAYNDTEIKQIWYL